MIKINETNTGQMHYSAFILRLLRFPKGQIQITPMKSNNVIGVIF